jgi:hypothetical protein
MEERVVAAVVVRNGEAAGLRLLKQESFLSYQYLLVLGK